jgi:ubiquinone/menaquinone biosynthesis C-methylase UbiE
MRRLIERLAAWIGVAVQTRIVEGLLLRRRIERLYLVMGGHIFFQTLCAAIQFDLFTMLARHGRMNRSDIARELGCAEKPIRILLLGCVTLGLIRKRGPFYSNSAFSKQLLVRDSATSIVPVIEWQHYINYKAMYHFAEAIRAGTNIGLREFGGAGPTLYERLAHDAALEKIFQDAMERISLQANAMLASFVDFSRVRHLVDVGGGNATNIIALAKRHPHLRATVFDFPSICRIAAERIAAEGLAYRLGTWPGDCMRDPFPPEADCILFAHFFTIWSEDRNRDLLAKAYRSLPSGGSVIVFNMMQHDTEDGPLPAAMGSPYFLTLATGEGMLYTWREYMEWMKEAGFHPVRRQRLPRSHGAIIGYKT